MELIEDVRSEMPGVPFEAAYGLITSHLVTACWTKQPFSSALKEDRERLQWGSSFDTTATRREHLRRLVAETLPLPAFQKSPSRTGLLGAPRSMATLGFISRRSRQRTPRPWPRSGLPLSPLRVDRAHHAAAVSVLATWTITFTRDPSPSSGNYTTGTIGHFSPAHSALDSPALAKPSDDEAWTSVSAASDAPVTSAHPEHHSQSPARSLRNPCTAVAAVPHKAAQPLLALLPKELHLWYDSADGCPVPTE
ncbi:hypothetical protein CYMTET_11772 [Cymbomonas tetramitiformis]|uniref:Uncharacterized protein n=1 Tax=Cymbomonas tetramitiformis TaxID=36881 RepID=A0AAE0GLL3_9CHLO|nr:hypothetical protein CYMTET_11772 [Cymbomonas tetramitiformis]